MNYDEWKQQTPDDNSDYYDMSERYSKAKQLVIDAKVSLEQVNPDSNYYKLFAKFGEYEETKAWRKRVLKRCLDIHSRVQSAYFAAELEFENSFNN